MAKFYAPLAELVDAADLGSVIERCESSSLLGGTNMEMWPSLAYGNSLENCRRCEPSVSSNLTVSAKLYLLSSYTGTPKNL